VPRGKPKADAPASRLATLARLDCISTQRVETRQKRKFIAYLAIQDLPDF
jgi:hypothetical protein